MQTLIDFWAMTNTLVIMFALGLHQDSNAAPLNGWLLARASLYNLIIPALVLVALQHTALFSTASLSEMALCIAAAGGTSAGAFVKQAKGSQALIAQLIIFLLILSLLAITAFSALAWIDSSKLSLLGLAGYLLMITLLPLLAGKGVRQVFQAWASRWQVRLERLGSLLVILLVVALAIRYGKEILTGPIEPLLAATVLLLSFVLPSFFEPNITVRRTIILATLVRNLTLVLSLLAVLPKAADILPTVLAFGLLMYLMVAVLLSVWRKSSV